MWGSPVGEMQELKSEHLVECLRAGQRPFPPGPLHHMSGRVRSTTLPEDMDQWDLNLGLRLWSLFCLARPQGSFFTRWVSQSWGVCALKHLDLSTRVWHLSDKPILGTLHPGWSCWL